MNILTILFTTIKAVLSIYTLATIVCSAVAVNQERKLWAPANMPSLSVFAMMRNQQWNTHTDVVEM